MGNHAHLRSDRPGDSSINSKVDAERESVSGDGNNEWIVDDGDNFVLECMGLYWLHLSFVWNWIVDKEGIHRPKLLIDCKRIDIIISLLFLV